MLRTTVTIPGNWPPFKPGEVLRIKNATGTPGLWRTYENFVPVLSGYKKGNPPQRFTADVDLHPKAPGTNKTALTHPALAQMKEAA